jgi:hypothetical protein
MLSKQGLTTWPETWCLLGENTLVEWRCRDSRSAARSAGLGPALAAFREIAGIRPLDAGMNKVLFAPRPGPLQTFKTVFPTPRGRLEVSYQT